MKTRILATLVALSVLAHADVRLPAIISDHMVLQAETEAPIWGWAEPGEEVSVALAGTTKTTKADAAGKWKVVFSKLKPGASLTLKVKGKNELTVNDVAVGEVWLCSGQSNMAMSVERSNNFEQEKVNATLPIRMFTVERSPQPQPQDDCKGSWVRVSMDTVGKFSATAYFFGRGLHVGGVESSIGLINSSVGGTAVEAWTSHEAQSKLAEYATISEPWTKLTAVAFDEAAAEKKFQEQRAKWLENVKAAKEANKPLPRGPQKPIDPRLQPNHPANLFNGMIAPIIPYGIRGAIWYQGESNAAKPFANLYGLQLRTMIADWRGRWGHDFPFAWVQLPDFRAPQKEPSEPTGWVTVREQMLKTLSVPKTGMAITLGLGEEKDIHPKNKQDVGARLARWARAEVYGGKRESSGPLPGGHKIADGKVTITFTHAEGLRVKGGGAVKGFAIAGADKKFVWADALIDGDKVIVSSPEVKEPAAVRYAWADNPVWSLENAGRLPASPFRTDDWPIEAAATSRR
ncbi:MAG: sialate O-acetylesterase [Chthoniobacteraceae bacterium]